MTTEAPRPTIIDLKRVMMFADTPGVEGKRSKLVWSVRDGHPRISVFTNDPKDTTNKGIISAPMNPETFYAFLDLIENTTKIDSEVIYKVECLTAKRDAEGKVNYNEKVHVSDAYTGRDANGMVWISLVATNRPKVKFLFKISDYHKIYKSGVPLTESEASCIQAMATVNIVRAAFYPLVSTNNVVNGNTNVNDTNANERTIVNLKPGIIATLTEDIPF